MGYGGGRGKWLVGIKRVEESGRRYEMGVGGKWGDHLCMLCQPMYVVATYVRCAHLCTS